MDAVEQEAITALAGSVNVSNPYKWREYLTKWLVAVRGTATAYSGMYKRNFTEENAELRITTNGKRQPILTINGLSVSDWCEQKWQQLIHRNRSQRL